MAMEPAAISARPAVTMIPVVLMAPDKPAQGKRNRESVRHTNHDISNCFGSPEVSLNVSVFCDAISSRSLPVLRIRVKQQGPRSTGFFQSPSRWIFWPHLMPAEDRQFCCRSNPSRRPDPPAALLLHRRLYYRWNAATQSAQLPPFPDPISKLTDITARFASGLGSKQKRNPRSNQCTRKQCSSGVPVQNFISHRSLPFLRTTTIPDSDPTIGHA